MYRSCWDVYSNILDAELKEYRVLTADYHRKGDEKFLERNFRGAYADYLHAMKILGEHGNITDEFGGDMKMLRVYQDKCSICFWALYKRERNQVFLLQISVKKTMDCPVFVAQIIVKLKFQLDVLENRKLALTFNLILIFFFQIKSIDIYQALLFNTRLIFCINKHLLIVCTFPEPSYKMF